MRQPNELKNRWAVCSDIPPRELLRPEGAHRPPLWLWPVSIALQIGAALWLNASTYFFQDDFLFLEQARTQPFGLTYLREDLFEHFSPVSRLLDSVLALTTPPSFALARTIQMVLFAATLAAFGWVMVTILGHRWSALVVTVLFGQSLFLMRLLMWWTATANILPATCFGLLAMGFYLRWRRGGSAWQLAGSLLAFAVALLDYEDAMLLPVFLLLIRLLVLEDRLTPLAWLRAVWKEKWAWLAYGVMDVVALANYLLGYYVSVARPSLAQLGRFLELGLFESFIPALFGVKDPQLPVTSHLGLVVALDLIAVLGVGIVVWRRPRAWRCVVVFVLVFLIAMVPLGLNRITLFGVGIGQELYYQQSVQFMFWILVAFTLAPAGQLARSVVGRRWGGFRLPIKAWAAGTAVVVAAYSVAYVSSVGALAASNSDPQQSSQYVNGFLRAASQVRATSGQAVDLVDLTVPFGVLSGAFFPYTRYDMFLALVDPGVRIDQAAPEIFTVSPSGGLVPESFHAVTEGALNQATVWSMDGSEVGPAQQVGSAEACVPSGPGMFRLVVPLSRSVNLVANGPPLYGVSVRYVEPVASSVTVLVTEPEGMIVDEAVPHQWEAGAGSDLFPLLAPAVRQLDGLAFDLVGGSCVTGLSLGEFVAAGQSG